MAANETRADLEMLVDRVKGGDHEATQRVLDYYHTLIKKDAAKLYGPSLEHGDLIAAAMMSVARTLHTYDPAMGTLINFIMTAARRGMYTELVKAKRLKCRPLNTAVTDMFLFSDESDGDHRCSVEDAAEGPSSALADMIETEDVAEMVKDLSRRLTPLEQKVLQAVIDGGGGLSYQELAHRTGYGLKTVDNALWRIRNKAAELGCG